MQLNLDKLWSHNIILTTRLVDTVTTPLLMKTKSANTTKCVEGHVPADDIVRLITKRPDARGLAVPGMPLGSPGMDMPSGETQPYDVKLIARDGSATDFSHHGN